MIRYIRNIILTALFLALITTNILTLFYQPFTTALSAAISSAFGISAVTSLLSVGYFCPDRQDLKISGRFINTLQICQ